MSNFTLSSSLTRTVWSKLKNGPVPIVDQSDMKNIKSFVEDYNTRLRSRDYVPGVGHGYLGLQKGNGVTRFLPILSKEDMAVYCNICGQIGGKVIKDTPCVFGGWRSIPTSQKSSTTVLQQQHEIEATASQNNYFSDSFSNSMWFQEFQSFTKLIKRLTHTSSGYAYIAQTDVANFYDSIEIPRLVRSLRKDIHGDPQDIELLEVFLSLWNRRTTGYTQSTKGIPQEIISDGSRFLSHYYLQNFDKIFRSYCSKQSLKYVRWADDILIFGPSKKTLEQAIHVVSSILLAEGLNLSAPKTRIFSRDEFAKYRGLEVLSAINADSPVAFRRKLRSSIDWRNNGNLLRLDTVFRATIGYTFRLGTRARMFEKNFLLEIADESPDLLETLNDIQLLHLIQISDDPKEIFLKIRKSCLERPFTSARANFLMLIRRRCRQLVRAGVTKNLQKNSIAAIIKASPHSEIIQKYCANAAKHTLGSK